MHPDKPEPIDPLPDTYPVSDFILYDSSGVPIGYNYDVIIYSEMWQQLYDYWHYYSDYYDMSTQFATSRSKESWESDGMYGNDLASWTAFAATYPDDSVYPMVAADFHTSYEWVGYDPEHYYPPDWEGFDDHFYVDGEPSYEKKKTPSTLEGFVTLGDETYKALHIKGPSLWKGQENDVRGAADVVVKALGVKRLLKTKIFHHKWW